MPTIKSNDYLAKRIEVSEFKTSFESENTNSKIAKALGKQLKVVFA
ncbi:hypothetical protein [Enterococcus faecium]|nr:hypothetical protein [Enterococcus faecium]OTN91550.1 hypothetical protein A5809_000915 [Enterococcus faecium]